MSQRRLCAGLATLAMASASAAALVSVAPAQEQPPRPSLNLYGVTGLIDMPSAQSQPDGQVSLSYSQFGETSRRNFSFQVLPRVSGTLRYSTIKNWGQRNDEGVYDPSYDLSDRSFDLQFQLLNEDRDGWVPSLAIGLRDFLGTGVYSSEYIVATKTVAEDFTVTGGIGWGRLSGVGGFKNPFCAISSSFCDRENNYGQGGNVSYGTFFHGEDAALFGGVEWRTPIEKLTLKAEYSSDAYEREQRSPASTFKRKSPFNFGAEYRWREGVTVGGYYMYGDTIGFNIALSGNPNDPLTPQDLGTGPLPVVARAPDAPQGTAWATNPAARDAAGQRARRGAEGRGPAARGDGRPADRGRHRHHQPHLQRGAAGDRPRGARAGGGHAGFGRDLPRHDDAGRSGDHHHHHRPERPSNPRSTGRAPR